MDSLVSSKIPLILENSPFTTEEIVFPIPPSSLNTVSNGATREFITRIPTDFISSPKLENTPLSPLIAFWTGSSFDMNLSHTINSAVSAAVSNKMVFGVNTAFNTLALVVVAVMLFRNLSILFIAWSILSSPCVIAIRFCMVLIDFTISSLSTPNKLNAAVAV